MWCILDTDRVLGAAVTVRVQAGPVGTALTRRRAEELQELRRTELDRIRTAAEKWRNGLAALLALITTIGVVKGQDTIADLPRSAQVTVGALLAAALIAASTGAFLAMRAAYGLPRAEHLLGDPSDFDRYRWQETRRAVADVRIAIALTFLTLGLLTFAIGMTWYTPRIEAGMVRVVSAAKAPICGKLISANATSMTIEVQKIRETIPISSLHGFMIVRDCKSEV
jgi:hypothetical protein